MGLAIMGLDILGTSGQVIEVVDISLKFASDEATGGIKVDFLELIFYSQ